MNLVVAKEEKLIKRFPLRTMTVATNLHINPSGLEIRQSGQKLHTRAVCQSELRSIITASSSVQAFHIQFNMFILSQDSLYFHILHSRVALCSPGGLTISGKSDCLSDQLQWIISGQLQHFYTERAQETD